MATNAQKLGYVADRAGDPASGAFSPVCDPCHGSDQHDRSNPYAKAQKAFLYAELQTDSWKDKPADLLRYMTSRDNFTGADSLNALFPWQSGSWPTDWPATIQQKWNAVLNRLPHRRGAAHAQPEDTAVINFDTVGTVNTWSQNAHDFSAQHIEELTSMLQLCQENGTRLLLISAPKTTLDVVSYETYFDDYAYFKQLAAQYGASYYDFNLAKPELFENKEPDYHKDFTHMNAAGGHAFSLSMAKFLAMLDAGQDVGIVVRDAVRISGRRKLYHQRLPDAGGSPGQDFAAGRFLPRSVRTG